MSQQTKVILFKKIQKEVETAIRKSDTASVGSLSKHLLACSLHELGYLKTAIPEFFTDCLWSIINPRRALTVSNAVVYDILLLLTYKVNLSVPQLTTALSEYLHRMYVE